MKVEHTKGPWRVGKNGCSIVADHPVEGGIQGTDNVEAEGGHLVAETCAAVNIPLLRTAPELLDVLQALVDIWDDQTIAPEYRCYVEGAWDSILIEARAVITKVTGETS